MTDAAAATPERAYRQRLEQRTATAATLSQADDRLAMLRGVVFLAGLGNGIAALIFSPVLWWGTALATLVFVPLVIRHGFIVRALKDARAAIAYYETGLARVNSDWFGVGPNGERYRNPKHVFSNDLDLFGDGSLFQLQCRARTRLGEDRLADWLLNAADPETVARRQKAVKELRDHLDLREKLALLKADVHDGYNQNQLRGWSTGTPEPFSPAVRMTAVALSGLTCIALIGFFVEAWTIRYPVIAGAVLIVYLFSFGKRVKQSAESAEDADSGLRILSQVLELIENERFDHDVLQQMQAKLKTDGRQPSAHIHRLDRLIQSLNNALQNQFFAIFGFLFALPIHLVHAIETWRAETGSHIPEWLDAVADFESLVSIAGYAYENPGSIFPDVVTDGPRFEAMQIGHPLLPTDQCVRNDLALNDDCLLILISGSNMSGKSTLLRSVGVNAVLAFSGAPVRAEKLTLSPLQVASSMRVQDSLQDGRSLFYSALQRMKAIVDASENADVPVLFLLDEILSGTNSHDRRIGAEGVINTLVARGGIGLVTTHDLALTEMVTSFDGKATNSHFQDEIVDGTMTFDYQLRDGVVEKSNALDLMRSMGLDV